MRRPVPLDGFSRYSGPGGRAFTLIEVLVASVVLLLLLGVVFAITSGTGAIISRTSARIDAFASGRAAFDLLTQRLSQATLNTYYDYFDASGRASVDPYYNPYLPATPPPFNPARYGRQSDLQFLVRQTTETPGQTGYGQEVYFVTPRAYSNQTSHLATGGLLNACSFFVQYSRDVGIRPALLESAGTQGAALPYRWRYRLMGGIQPTENLTIFQSVFNGDLTWIGDIANGTPSTVSKCVAPVADNIISLIIWPRLSENDDPAGTQLASGSGTYPFLYNSKAALVAPVNPTPNPGTINQLPPNLEVALVAISEASAQRLGPAASVNSSATATAPAPTTVESALKLKFTDIAQYATDLANLANQLAAADVQFQIFSTIVPMRESRWTSSNP